MPVTGWWVEVLVNAAPTGAALSVTGGTPAVKVGLAVTPGGATLTVTGATPTVTATQNRLIQPAAAALTIIGSHPALGETVRPTEATLSVTGGTPAVTQGVAVRPTGAALTVTGGTPTVTATDHKIVQPTGATLTVTGSAPTIGVNVLLTPAGAALTVTGGSPSLGFALRPTGAALTVTGSAPTVAVSNHKIVQPVGATLTVTGAAPRLDQGLRPTGASLTITGGTPTVTVTPLVYVQRDTATGNLMLSGTRYRFGGANVTNFGLIETGANYSGESLDADSLCLASHSEIDAILDAAALLNVRHLRAYGAVMSVGKIHSVQPTFGSFSSANLEPVDYALQQCAIRGIKVVLPLVDNYSYYVGGKLTYLTWLGLSTANDGALFYTDTSAINAFKAHIAFVLDHVNVYTGLAYRNDPTIMAWETGNELSSSSSIASWTNSIASYIKTTKSAQQLVMDGGNYDGTDTAMLTNTNTDILSCHSYDDVKSPKWMDERAAEAHAAKKAWYMGEYPWNDVRLNPPSADVVLAWTFTDLLSRIDNSSVIDGDAPWRLDAPLTSWTDYTIHAPGDDANMVARDSQLATHNAFLTANKTARVLICDANNSSTAGSNSRSVTFSSANWTPRQGDVVVLWCASTGFTGIVVPAGWVNPLGGNTAVASDAHTYYVLFHEVTQAEAAAGTMFYEANAVQGTLAGNTCGVVLRGLDQTNPFGAVATSFNSGDTTTPHIMPGLTPVADDSLVIGGVAKAGAGSYTQPDGWGRVDYNTSQTAQFVGSRNQLTQTGVAVAATNITPSGGDEYASITVEWRPRVIVPSLYPPVKRPNYGALLQQ